MFFIVHCLLDSNFCCTNREFNRDTGNRRLESPRLQGHTVREECTLDAASTQAMQCVTVYAQEGRSPRSSRISYLRSGSTKINRTTYEIWNASRARRRPRIAHRLFLFPLRA
jgi:hypothetical protein